MHVHKKEEDIPHIQFSCCPDCSHDSGISDAVSACLACSSAAEVSRVDRNSIFCYNTICNKFVIFEWCCKEVRMADGIRRS